VMAIRCKAALSWRLPPRLSRCRTRLPDHTGIGAVPVCAANAARERKRPMGRARPATRPVVHDGQVVGVTADPLSCLRPLGRPVRIAQVPEGLIVVHRSVRPPGTVRRRGGPVPGHDD
jgi:hypothetical protein